MQKDCMKLIKNPDSHHICMSCDEIFSAYVAKCPKCGSDRYADVIIHYV